MTALSRSRVAVAAGLTFGTATVSLAFAPAALADHLLPALEGPSSVVAGEPFELTGTDCTATKAGESANFYVDVYAAADLDDPNAEPVFFGDDVVDADGTWTAAAFFAADITPGEYVILASCEPYSTSMNIHGYPDFPITVTAPAATPTTSTPAAPVAVTGAIKGTAAITPGISRTSTATTAASPAVPGKQVTKVLKGFKPGEKVTVVLHSTPQTLGVFTADANGVVTATFTVPAGTALGDHTLVFEGDQGSYYQETFTVAASTAVTPASSGLAYTGADVAVPLALGGALVLAGGGALLVTRRRSAQA